MQRPSICSILLELHVIYFTSATVDFARTSQVPDMKYSAVLTGDSVLPTIIAPSSLSYFLNVSSFKLQLIIALDDPNILRTSVRFEKYIISTSGIYWAVIKARSRGVPSPFIDKTKVGLSSFKTLSNF
ncbi:hypothetical protein PLICRDRAFT_603731 [Plicaturopsis crispa FD-325 SS-3]|nr:hypothetical protein PLICRDRAFT_603731 [Plicaturopsis crispa FD-325 SS-3]